MGNITKRTNQPTTEQLAATQQPESEGSNEKNNPHSKITSRQKDFYIPGFSGLGGGREALTINKYKKTFKDF